MDVSNQACISRALREGSNQLSELASRMAVGVSVRAGGTILCCPLMLLLVSAGCTAGEPPPVTSHGGPVRDHVSLVDNLRAAGLRVDPTGPVSQPFLTASGETLHVDGETIQAFEYPDEGAAAKDASSVSSDGSKIGNAIVDWVGPPHFY